MERKDKRFLQAAARGVLFAGFVLMEMFLWGERYSLVGVLVLLWALTLYLAFNEGKT